MEISEKKVDVLFEDAYLLVLNKPAGMVTTKENQGTNLMARETMHVYLEDWVDNYFPNNMPRKGVVHRLDKGTSGLVVVAKTENVLVRLKEMFKKRQMKKTYIALVSGDFPFEADIQMPIKRSNYGFDKYSVSEDGKFAWTKVRLLGKFKIGEKIYSKLLIDLMTGRTHQIRVHLSYLRYPIVGDRLYGGETILERPFLHASQICFIHPVTGKELVLTAELSNDLLDFVDKYEFLA